MITFPDQMMTEISQLPGEIWEVGDGNQSLPLQPSRQYRTFKVSEKTMDSDIIPYTFGGLEDARIAVARIDVMRGASLAMALAFIYPRLLVGGYLVIHGHGDPSRPEVTDTFNAFMEGKDEKAFIVTASTLCSAHFRRRPNVYLDEGSYEQKIRRYTTHLLLSITAAYEGKSRLPPSHLSIRGMATHRIRHFLNTFGSLPNARYLEVGLYMGSSFLCATVNNPSLISVGIDNYSQFQNPDGQDVRQIFHDGLRQFLPPEQLRRTYIVEENAFKVPPMTLPGPFNLYYYDADHSAEAQYLALKHFAPALDDVFCLAIDNWDDDVGCGPRKGTLKAIAELGWRFRYFEECRFDGAYRGHGGEQTPLVPNFFVAVVEKHPRSL